MQGTHHRILGADRALSAEPLAFRDIRDAVAFYDFISTSFACIPVKDRRPASLGAPSSDRDERSSWHS